MAIYAGSGFPGALIGGFLAGYITQLITNHIHLPKVVAGLNLS
nr:hypothetical protein [Pantoea vagans]